MYITHLFRRRQRERVIQRSEDRVSKQRDRSSNILRPAMSLPAVRARTARPKASSGQKYPDCQLKLYNDIYVINKIHKVLLHSKYIVYFYYNTHPHV